MLRTAREKTGLAIDDVVFQTGLPQSVIEALEAEDFSRFASPVYAKSFLAQYSDFLNVLAAPWLDALKPSAYLEGDPLRPILTDGGTATHEPLARSESRGGGFSAIWLLLVSCALVFGAIRVFELFEARFGVDTTRPPLGKKLEDSPIIEKAPMLVSPPKVEPAPDPIPPPVENAAFRPAPRAIIVR